MLITDSELDDVSDDLDKFLKVLQVKTKQAGLPWTARPNGVAKA